MPEFAGHGYRTREKPFCGGAKNRHLSPVSRRIPILARNLCHFVAREPQPGPGTNPNTNQLGKMWDQAPA
jgi:hypothetical protein